VQRLEESGHLLERLVETNQELFISKGQSFRDAHRDGTSRPLHAAEAAQLAVAMTPEGTDQIGMAEQLQQSSLRAYDEPAQREVLLAAGVGTAPAFIAAVRDFVALVEMPVEEFERACEDEVLPDVIAERSKALRRLPLDEARARASAALAHYSAAAGVSVGEALGLLTKTVWQALQQAGEHLNGDSRPSQLIDSAEPTEDSTPATSSTGSHGEGLSS